MTNISSKEQFAFSVITASDLKGSDVENIERALEIYQKSIERFDEHKKSNRKPARVGSFDGNVT